MAEKQRRPRPPELPAKHTSRAQYDQVLLMAALMGRSVAQAAAMAAVSETTVKRRHQDPDFRRLLGLARQDAFRHVSEGLKSAALVAVSTLTEVMADAPVIDPRCTREAHWVPQSGRHRCKCSDGAPASARVAAASRVLELTLGRRYEITTTVAATEETASPADRLSGFLDNLQRKADAAREIIEATVIEEDRADAPDPPPPMDPTPPADRPAPGVADPPPGPT